MEFWIQVNSGPQVFIFLNRKPSDCGWFIILNNILE